MNSSLYKRFLTSRIFWVVTGSIVVFMVIVTIYSYLPKNEVGLANKEKKPGIFKLNEVFDSEKKPDLESAVDEQIKVVEEFANFENRVAGRYPWRKKLPLTSDKYFVYFDLNKKTFIGRLYPDDGDALEELKAEIIRILKKDKAIPLEEFKFDIDVYPKSAI